MSQRCAALLRGVNVGKAKRVSMADLRALGEHLGYRDVETLLNSGNVVFTVPGRVNRRTVAARIEAALASRVGVMSRVTVLTADDLETIVSEHPLRAVADHPSRLLVTVVTDPADLALLGPLCEQSWAPSVLALGSRAAYAWCPDGLSASDLPVAMARVLRDGATGRNWATIAKLLDMVRGG